MKYKYYGTAAAEGIPALWCECDTCRKARKLKGKNIMSRSQSVVDDRILIDFSSDTFMHTVMGLDLTNLHTCIITHAHPDHLYAEDFIMRAKWFATIKKDVPFDVYIAREGAEIIKNIIASNNRPETFERVNVIEFAPFVPFEAEGYTIIPLKADHNEAMGSVIFLIKRDGKCILHANDTGYFPKETWEYLKDNKTHIDFASFDCTEPKRDESNAAIANHMNMASVVSVRDRLKEMGQIDDSTICVVNHFSHNGGMIYDELKLFAESKGFLTSYDGMEIKF